MTASRRDQTSTDVAITGVPPPSLEAIAARPKVPSSLYTSIKEWQTRLLRLWPDEANAVVRCELVVVDLVYAEGVMIHCTVEQCQYEALSYSWGYAEATETIICNGECCLISPSLAAALGVLRPGKSEVPRYLWVDAFCINQADLPEKSVQVQKMGLIFRKASKVLIWLGDTHVVEQMSRLINKHNNPSVGSSESAPEIHIVHEESSAEEKREWLGYVRSRWFSRTWIRQETYYARRLVFIPEAAQLTWHMMLKACWNLLDAEQSFLGLDTPLTGPVGPILLMESQNRERPELQNMNRQELREMVLSSLMNEASDPRDKVFGVIGMYQRPRDYGVNDAEIAVTNDVKVDYTKTVADVYTDLSKMVLGQTGHLGLLEMTKPGPILPSWVMDWDRPEKRLVCTIYDAYGQDARVSSETIASEDRGLYPKIWFHLDEAILGGISKPVLHLNGRKIAIVESTDHERSSQRSLFPLSRVNAKPDKSSTEHNTYWISAQVKTIEQRLADEVFFAVRGRNQRELPLRSLRLGWLWRKVSFPANTKPGDVVVVLEGGATLFAIRPLEHVTPILYTFVGALRFPSRNMTPPEDPIIKVFRGMLLYNMEQGKRKLTLETFRLI